MSKKGKPHRWVITVAISSFILSFLFSYISNTAVTKLNIFLSILILLLVIFIGVIFDLISVAVIMASEEHFHAKASKKIAGSKTAVKLIRNSAQVSNFLSDVIGDICGIISGALSAIIALKLTEYYGMNSHLQFAISALVASITISGKAITKEIAKNHSTAVVSFITRFVNFE